MSYTVNVGLPVCPFHFLITSPDRFPVFLHQQQNSNCTISSRMLPVAFTFFFFVHFLSVSAEGIVFSILSLLYISFTDNTKDFKN